MMLLHVCMYVCGESTIFTAAIDVKCISDKISVTVMRVSCPSVLVAICHVLMMRFHFQFVTVLPLYVSAFVSFSCSL